MLNSCKVRRNTQTREIDQVVIDRPFTDERANVIYNYYRSVGIPIHLGKEAMRKELKKRGFNVDLEVAAWHGSPHLFQKFSTQFMGSGEGAQAFGWGLYFTDLESIARKYADVLSKQKYSINGEVFTRQELNWGEDATLHRISYDVEMEGLSMEEAIDREIELKKYHIANAKRLKDKEGEDSHKRLLEFAKSLKGKRVGFAGRNRNLYKATLHKGKTPEQYTWLEWDKPVPQDILDKIANGFEKTLGENVSIGEPKTGEELYDAISLAIGANRSGLAKKYGDDIWGSAQKISSLFLLENGIDGIKYPAESISRGATSDNARGFNYVVFDENAITIEEQIQFLSTPQGKVYGFVTPEGEMFLDPDIAGVNTLIHEGAHIQYKVLKTAAERGDIKAQAILNKIQELTAPAVETIFNAKKAQERSSDSMPSVDMQAEQSIIKKMPELTELANKNIQIIKDYDRYQRILQKQAEGRRVLKTDRAFLDSHLELKNPPILDFGTPSDILRSVGITNPIKVSMSHINRKLVGKEAHELTLLDLQDLMRAIHNPATVNKGAKGRVQLLTNHTNSNGAPIVVVIDNNYKKNTASITTAYALNNLAKVVPGTPQDVLYTNNKKLADFLSDYSESKNRGFGIALFAYPEYDSSTGTIKYTQEKTNPEIEFDIANIRKIIENTKNIINKTNVSRVDFQVQEGEMSPIFDSEGNLNIEELNRIVENNLITTNLTENEKEGLRRASKYALGLFIISREAEKKRATDGQELVGETTRRAIEDYSRAQQKIWSQERINQNYDYFSEGSEAVVYKSKDGTHVLKQKNVEEIELAYTPTDFIKNRVILYNTLFPDSTYEIVGITEQGDFLLKQDFVEGKTLTELFLDEEIQTREEVLEIIDKEVKRRFEVEREDRGIYFTKDYIIADISEYNIVQTTDGRFIIDAITVTNNQNRVPLSIEIEQDLDFQIIGEQTTQERTTISPEVLSSPTYNQRENETDEQYKERLREEVFARALGDNAEQYLKDLGFTAQEAKTFLQKVQEFLAEIVDWLRGKKGLQDLSVDEINKLSIREFLDRSTTSMMLGEFRDNVLGQAERVYEEVVQNDPQKIRGLRQVVGNIIRNAARRLGISVEEYNNRHRALFNKNSDITTIIHEKAHEYEEVLTQQEIAVLEEWSGHKKGTVEFSEAFAKGAEKVLYDGEFGNSEVNNIFVRFAQWFKSVIENAVSYFSDINEMNQDVLDIYANMMVKTQTEIPTQDSFYRESDFNPDGTVKESVLQEIAEERRQIEEEAQANGTWMKAPNGNPTNLNEEQWVTVRTKRFKDWFGDWQNDPQNASKVVDENGEPLITYHGSKENFTVFNEKQTNNSGYGGYYQDVSFFTDDKKVAENFAGKNGKVYEVFLNIKNPYYRDGRFVSPTTKLEYEDDSNDGIIINNADTGAGIATEYLIDTEEFSPNQIKSATDNVGTFSSESNNINFQIIGTQGAQALDAAEQTTERMDNLAVALEMEAAGKTPQDIRLATGWEQGADGKWRYEIDDSIIDKNISDIPTITVGNKYTYKKAALSEILSDSKDLFTAYPYARDIEVVFYDFNHPDGTRGTFREKNSLTGDTITLWGVDFNQLSDSNVSTILHEVQHYIQTKESFAEGGNTRTVREGQILNKEWEDFHSTENQSKYKEYVKLRNSEKYTKELLESNEVFESRYDNRITEIYNNSSLSHTERIEALDSILKEFENYSQKNFPTLRRVDEIANNYIVREPKKYVFGFEGYRSLVGEVEARNVQTRMNMTPQQRRETLLQETEDVPRVNQLLTSGTQTERIQSEQSIGSEIQGVQVLEYQGSTLSYKQRVNPITNQPTNQIEIDLISVPQENRNQGHARELLRRITEIADSRGQELYLFAAPRDRTTTTEGLIKLYKEFGFESISPFLPEEMVRPARRITQRAEESLVPTETLYTEDIHGVQEYVPANSIITYYSETGEINYKRNSEGDLVMLKTVSATPQQEESITYQQLLSIPNLSKEQALEAYKNLYSTKFYDWNNKTNECN